MTRRQRLKTAITLLIAGPLLASGCVPNREGGLDVVTASACRPVPLSIGTETGVSVQGIYDIAVSPDAGVILLAGTTAVPTQAATVSADGLQSDGATTPPAGVYGIVVGDLARWLTRTQHPAAGATVWPAPEPSADQQAAAEQAEGEQAEPSPAAEAQLEEVVEPIDRPLLDRASIDSESAADRAGGSDGVDRIGIYLGDVDAAEATEPKQPAKPDNRIGASAVRVEMSEALTPPAPAEPPAPTEPAAKPPAPEATAGEPGAAGTAVPTVPPLPVANLSGDFAAEHPFYPVGLSVVLQPDLSAEPARARAVGLMVANRASTPVGDGSLEMFVFAPGGLIYQRSLALPESCPPLDVAALDAERAFVTLEGAHPGCAGGLSAGGAPGPVGASQLVYVNGDQAQVVATGLDDARSLSLEPLNFWSTRRHLAVAGARSGTVLVYDLSDLLTGTRLSQPSQEHLYTVDLPYTVRSVQWTSDGLLYGAAALETIELAALGTGVEIPTAIPNDRGRVWRLHAPRGDITVPSLIRHDEAGTFPDLNAVAVAGELLLLGSATTPGLQVCRLTGTPPYDENLIGIQPDR